MSLCFALGRGLRLRWALALEASTWRLSPCRGVYMGQPNTDRWKNRFMKKLVKNNTLAQFIYSKKKSVTSENNWIHIPLTISASDRSIFLHINFKIQQQVSWVGKQVQSRYKRLPKSVEERKRASASGPLPANPAFHLARHAVACRSDKVSANPTLPW